MIEIGNNLKEVKWITSENVSLTRSSTHSCHKEEVGATKRHISFYKKKLKMLTGNSPS
jgi:hypothetical protein